jgi:hypothetical protein
VKPRLPGPAAEGRTESRRTEGPLGRRMAKGKRAQGPGPAAPPSQPDDRHPLAVSSQGVDCPLGRGLVGQAGQMHRGLH